ncbi:MAG: hypothetical protein ABIL05_03815 [candidate division WOR-3 bacterium]
MDITWLNYVDVKRRRNLLKILQELSKLQDKENPNFIIIGAMALLIADYLSYTAQWDVDLLFKNSNALRDFINLRKSSLLQIVNYDDDYMTSENITSFHTAWSFGKGWFNVDYILRANLFEFYADRLDELAFYNQSIKFENEIFSIALYLAHPWDIFLEKVLSPRTAKELELKVDLSVDIRHIFLIYEKEKDCAEFWQRVLAKARRFNKERQFKETLLKVFDLRKELGYGGIEISPFSVEQLR